MGTQQAEAEWIEWAGGVCPALCDEVEYKIRCMPDDVFGPTPPLSLRWDHGRTPASAADASLRRNDIIAYRVVSPQVSA